MLVSIDQPEADDPHSNIGNPEEDQNQLDRYEGLDAVLLQDLRGEDVDNVLDIADSPLQLLPDHAEALPAPPVDYMDEVPITGIHRLFANHMWWFLA